MLLSQQAQLVRLDSQRAVVRVAGTWMAMVQSRLPLLEKALAGALGSGGRQLVLEAGGEPKSPPAAVKTPPSPAAPPTSVCAPLSSSAQPDPAATPAAPFAPAQAPTRKEQPPGAPAPAATPAMPSPLEEKAKRLAEFFNGEVIEDDVTDQVA
jgi:DNA polymerase-3 subunit gamma/tau